MLETAKQKCSVDTHKAEKGKRDTIEYRGDALTTEFIHCDLFSGG